MNATAKRQRTKPSPKHSSPPSFWDRKEAEYLEIIATTLEQNERILGQRNALVDEVLRLKSVVERLADQVQRDADRQYLQRQEAE